MNANVIERINAHVDDLTRDWPELTEEQVIEVRAAFATVRMDGGSR